MRGWLIFFGIILLFCAIGFIKLNFIIKYDGQLSLTLKMLLLRIKLIPAKEKRIKIGDYSIRKIKKREEKQLKQKLKQEQKRKEKEEKKAKDKDKKKKLISSFSDVTELIKLVIEVSQNLFSKFFGYLKTEVIKLQIKVGGEEADKTAVTYGIVIQGVAYLFGILDTFSELKIKRHDSVDIQPDFTATGFSADINIVFKIRIWQVLACVFTTAWKFLRSKHNTIFKLKILNKENGGKKDVG